MNTLLIIDDDVMLSEGLRMVFTDAGYTVFAAYDGISGFEAVRQLNPDLIILDIGLPDTDGITLCGTMRSAGVHTPILMLTANIGEQSTVAGLNQGADDYLTKPYSISELQRRVTALLRRAQRVEEVVRVQVGDFVLNFGGKELDRQGLKIPLTSLETELLRYFFDRPRTIIPRDELLCNVWKYQIPPNTRTVDMFIRMLRCKIEENPSVPRHLLTVKNAGYRFVP